MLKVEHNKWGQCVEDLYRLSVDAPHKRTRERFHALHAIASGQASATTWSKQARRNGQTVMGWVHLYNAQGPRSLTYRHTGGPQPLFQNNRRNRSRRSSSATAPPTTG